jgi:hypothetical protein
VENQAHELRDLLKLAANLRRFAADACYPDYAPKFLRAAIELELRAQFIAGHRAGEPEPDWELEEVRHASVDLRI